MGKKSYDSSSGMSHGGGNRYATPKGNPLVGHTDTRKIGTDPGSAGDWKGAGKANVVGSRLNKGGDRHFMGGRRKPKMTGSYSGSKMPYS